eukprot:GFYU01000741.1.p1 GENE.GFYU01000741.1~~GFYU01000741.1.p1  ORF type:complete len:193 (-),score=41.65 GFYU01000741.1:359-937(-)
MTTVKGKILVIGDTKVGKTRLANILAGHDAGSTAYSPTVGVRVLECERQLNHVMINGYNRAQNVRLQVELWDCSGDAKYKACWPAMLKDADGVILMFNPELPHFEKGTEQWFKHFVQVGQFTEHQCILFAHREGLPWSTKPQKLKLPKMLEKIQKSSLVLNQGLDERDAQLWAVQQVDLFLSNNASKMANKI